MEARFLPPAAGAVARRVYRQAAQLEDETISQWHSRLRALATRAYPHRTPAQMETNSDLIHHFVEKLTNSTIMEAVLNTNPATYAAALTEATSRMGHHLCAKAARTGNRWTPQTWSTTCSP